MRIVQFIICGMFLYGSAYATTVFDFREATASKHISFDAFWSDQGTYLAVRIKNRSRQRIILKLVPGLTFRSDDHDVQPRVLAETRMVAMNAGEERQIYLNTYCGHALLMRGTGKGDLKFNKVEVQPDKLQQVLMTLEERQWTKVVSVQSIIWLFTNRHGLASALNSSLQGNERKKFEAYLASQFGEGIPVYRVKYAAPETDSDFAFTGKAEEIHGEFSYSLSGTQDVHLKLFSEKDQHLRTICSLPAQQSGTYKLPYRIDLSKVTPGNYVLVLEGAEGRIDNLPFWF